MAIYLGGLPLTSSKKWEGVVELYYSQSVLLNTTTIIAYVKSNTTNNTTQSLGETCFYGTISIAGRQSSFYYTTESATQTQHHKFEVEIRHNGSGRLHDCPISCTINAAVSSKWDFSSGILTGSMDFSSYIPRIPTESDFDSIEDINFGDAVAITWTPLSSSYYYTLTFNFEGKSAKKTVCPGTTSMYTYKGFTVPKSWANEIPNLAIGYIQVILQGYSNSSCTTKVGKESRATFTLTIPESFAPTITSCVATINNTGTNVPSGWGIAVSNHSKVSITAKATGQYGATIKSYRITGPIYTTVYSSSLSLTTDVIRSAGSKEFIITCTDSRGLVSAQYKTTAISFVDYYIPDITKLSVSRSKNKTTGKVSITVTANWNIAAVNNYNSATATLYYKLSTVDNWTKYSAAAPFPKNEKVQLAISIDELSSYNFKIVVKDSLNQTAEKEVFSSSTAVLLDFKAGGDGLGIGKVCEEPGLEISMDTTIYGNLYIGSKNQSIGSYIETFIDPLESIDVTLSASKWVSSNNNGVAPYYQKITISGMKSTMNYGPPFLFGITDLESLTAAKEALACLSYGTTANGSITLYCLEEKPLVDITVRMQGVKL